MPLTCPLRVLGFGEWSAKQTAFRKTWVAHWINEYRPPAFHDVDLKMLETLSTVHGRKPARAMRTEEQCESHLRWVLVGDSRRIMECTICGEVLHSARQMRDHTLAW